jgi:hypothetical protein
MRGRVAWNHPHSVTSSLIAAMISDSCWSFLGNEDGGTETISAHVRALLTSSSRL